MSAPTAIRSAETATDADGPAVPVTIPTNGSHPTTPSEIPPADTARVIDPLVANALQALKAFHELNQEQIDYIVKKATVAALDQHGQLARPPSPRPAAASSRTRQSRTSSSANTSRIPCSTSRPSA